MNEVGVRALALPRGNAFSEPADIHTKWLGPRPNRDTYFFLLGSSFGFT